MDNYWKEKRNEAIEWAKKIKSEPGKYLIFDTETTGLKENDVIIHFAVMDLEGNMLINTLVNPESKRRIHPDATALHGYTIKDLRGAPRFEQVFKHFRAVSEGKKLLLFNDFHSRLFEQTMALEGVAYDGFYLDYDDVRDQFGYYMMQEYLALPDRDHTGPGDCRAILAVIDRMANDEPEEIIEPEVVTVEIVQIKSKKGYSSSEAISIISIFGGCIIGLFSPLTGFLVFIFGLVLPRLSAKKNA